tara:strand:- start:73040 stop:74047 length:1008 start_codon:yes stop_codon:yes gene_type:complete
MKKQLILIFTFSLLNYVGFTQDTISFINGDQIIGELKSLDRGVISFKTDYSDSDFKIEWKGVKTLSTATEFLITTSDGVRFTGSVSDGDSTGLSLRTEEGVVKVPRHQIVYLKSLEDGFWSQVYAKVDVGFSLTKAKNLKQFNVNAGLGYLGEYWSMDARFNSLNSTQDSVAPTKRNDGGVTGNLFLPKDWFLTASVDYLSNTEQLLDLRLNGRVGLGYYLVHSNKWYWSVAGGTAFISENFASAEGDKKSMEAFFVTELNLFDFGDLSFFTKATAYPGITEKGRFRTDVNVDLKYDLPLDFYVKSGITVNYDNQPTTGASNVDYVFNSGIGWEW